MVSSKVSQYIKDLESQVASGSPLAESTITMLRAFKAQGDWDTMTDLKFSSLLQAYQQKKSTDAKKGTSDQNIGADAEKGQANATKMNDSQSPGWVLTADENNKFIFKDPKGVYYKFDPSTGNYVNSAGEEVPDNIDAKFVPPNGSNGTNSNGTDTSINGSVAGTVNSNTKQDPQLMDPAALSKVYNSDTTQNPWDRRLMRGDLFVNNNIRMPFASDEASPMFSDLIDYSVQKGNASHVVPSYKDPVRMMNANADLYGTLSIMNPYTVTRLYHGLDNLQVSGKFVKANNNRMLDIRSQKRFYDIKSPSNDFLSVSNPTVSNIIAQMNNDRWGRTPYSYQDFVFCKYFGRIPNNRMITLRKYAAPTYDNLCWELMGNAQETDMTNGKFAPIATAVTYFGGDTGNNLSDIFQISSGLNWDKVKAEIWNVNGDPGEVGTGQRIEDILAGGNNMTAKGDLGIFGDVFQHIGTIGTKALSLAKFFGIAKSPNAFDENAALASKMLENLHDPNENGPYENRIKGPINRIDEVYKRKEGIKFENKIVLKFAYKARPIGGINTKAVMLDIMSNLLVMCSATAVFWGGGHRFMITPREYPWSSVVSPGIIKDIFDGRLFGQSGAIKKTLDGFINAGGKGEGGWSWDNALKTLGSLGLGVLGVLSGAVNTMLSSLSGQIASEINATAQNLLNSAGQKVGVLTGNGAKSDSLMQEGIKVFQNIMSNTQNIWRANSIKESVLPNVEGMRSLLIGTPVGNWHLTVGNPLNPIAVIGNLICQDISFKIGEELGPDDFPDELEATITLEHGFARDKDAIESMFNRGAGRIYSAPDYARMFVGQVSSDAETKVDAVTGGTSARVPAAFTRMAPGTSSALNKGYGKYKVSSGTTPQNVGSPDVNINTPLSKIEVVDSQWATENVGYSRDSGMSPHVGVRGRYYGNWATRKYLG